VRPSKCTPTTGWGAGPSHPPGAAVGGHAAVGGDAAGGDRAAGHDPAAPTTGGTSHWRDAHPAVASMVSAPVRADSSPHDPTCTPVCARGTPIPDGRDGVGARDKQGGGVDACAGAGGAAAVASTAPTGSRKEVGGGGGAGHTKSCGRWPRRRSSAAAAAVAAVAAAAAAVRVAASPPLSLPTASRAAGVGCGGHTASGAAPVRPSICCVGGSCGCATCKDKKSSGRIVSPGEVPGAGGRHR